MIGSSITVQLSRFFSHNSEKNGIKGSCDHEPAREWGTLQHFVFRTTLFSLKLSKNPVRFVTAPLSGTHLGKLQSFTRECTSQCFPRGQAGVGILILFDITEPPGSGNLTFTGYQPPIYLRKVPIARWKFMFVQEIKCNTFCSLWRVQRFRLPALLTCLSHKGQS